MIRCYINKLHPVGEATGEEDTFALSLQGAVFIKRWRGRLWPTPWLNSHYALSSAKQGRRQQKHMAQGDFCVEIPAPGHSMFQQNYWMLGRGSWRMG